MENPRSYSDQSQMIWSHQDHLDSIYLPPVNICSMFPKLVYVNLTSGSCLSVFFLHCITPLITLYLDPVALLYYMLDLVLYSRKCIGTEKNADDSIFCVCRANLCVTNPSGTSGRRCDKNSHSLNLLKRKKYQNVANKRSRNS